MRNSLIIILLLITLNTFGQEFGMHWISYPEHDDSTEVCFKKAYLSLKPNKQAFINIASTGNTQLYVNERLVSKEMIVRENNEILQTTYNVTRYLKPDTNIIAVYYAPACKKPTDKQLSLSYYGISGFGTKFYFQANGSWYCKKGEGYVARGTEEFMDGRIRDMHWKDLETYGPAWKQAIASSDQTPYPVKANLHYRTFDRIAEFLSPVESVKNEAGDSITYDFGRSFNGQIRLTIRNAKRGEVINIGSFKYVCNGSTDEQACRRFTTSEQRKITITGDANFKVKHINAIEGLEIKPTTQKSYLF